MAKVALLIGVSEYEPGLNPLPNAVKDITAMERVLQNPQMGGFAETDVKLLQNPDRQVMEEAIENLFSNRKKDDLVLLFFSGHGVKDDSGRLYLTTSKTRKSQQGELIRSTAVPASFVQDSMSRSSSKRQVVVLDCCFSGAFAEGMFAKDDGSVDIKSQLGGEGRAILTSSTSTQYSFEQQGSALSVYTRYLVEGIETGAADTDSDGIVSIDELHEYAKRKVQEVAPAMKPEIFTAKEGYTIRLAQAPLGDPRLRYRKEVDRFASRGEIAGIARTALEAQRNKLGLSPEEAVAIEAEVLEPYRKYKQNLLQYEQAFLEAVQHEYPFTEEIRNDLSYLQQVLGLRDEDIKPIEEILTQPEEPDNSPQPMNAPKRSKTAPRSGKSQRTKQTNQPQFSTPNSSSRNPAVSLPSTKVSGTSTSTNSNSSTFNPTNTKAFSFKGFLPLFILTSVVTGGVGFWWVRAFEPFSTSEVISAPTILTSEGDTEQSSSVSQSAEQNIPSESQASKECRNLCKRSGALEVNFNFLEELADQMFREKHPELGNRQLNPTNPNDKELIEEWMQIANNSLSELEENLSLEARRSLGNFTQNDINAVVGEADNMIIESAFYDLVNAKLLQAFPDFQNKLDNPTVRNVWYAFAKDELQIVKSNPTSILKTIEFDYDISTDSEVGTSSGSLVSGQGVVYTVKLDDRQNLRLLIDDREQLVQVSVYSINSDQIILHLRNEVNVFHQEFAFTNPGKYYLVITPRSAELVSYSLDLSIFMIPEEDF